MIENLGSQNVKFICTTFLQIIIITVELIMYAQKYVLITL